MSTLLWHNYGDNNNNNNKRNIYTNEKGFSWFNENYIYKIKLYTFKRKYQCIKRSLFVKVLVIENNDKKRINNKINSCH